MSRIYVEFVDSILSWIPKGLVVFVMYTVDEEYGQVHKGKSYLVHDWLIHKSESNQCLTINGLWLKLLFKCCSQYVLNSSSGWLFH